MFRLIKFFRNILFRYDIEIAELQSVLAKLSSLLVLVGAFSLDNLQKFHAFMIGQQDKGLPIFCVALLAIGLLHLYGMIKESLVVRRFCAFLSVVVWTFLASVLAMQGAPIAFLLCSTFVLSSALVYLRLSGVLAKIAKRDTNYANSYPAIPSLDTIRSVSVDNRANNPEKGK